MGHSYWEIVDGDASSFNASVGAEFLHAGGSADFMTKHTRLTSRGGGRGLRPTSGASIFARTPQMISTSYSAFGPEAPIVVEYRQIPNAPVNAALIVWTTPKNIQVRFTGLSVGGAGSWFHDYSNWNMLAQCSVNGQAVADSTPFLTQRVADRSTVNVSFAPQFAVGDNDVIECGVKGTYSRGTGSLPLGQGTTGPITTRTLRSGEIQGQDANTSYSLTWTAMQLP
jgi:hypothetical protein